MGLRDELAAYSASPGTQCRVSRFLADLPDKDRDEVATVMGDRGISSTAFERWALAKHNVRVSDQSWARHRRGQCTCGTR